MVGVGRHHFLRIPQDDLEDVAPGEARGHERLHRGVIHNAAIAHQLQRKVAQRLQAGVR
ncbi:MAG: hypothetical protein ACJA1L_003452 [Paracoccaceae bacterium]|jgi:hypothetical protein